MQQDINHNHKNLSGQKAILPDSDNLLPPYNEGYPARSPQPSCPAESAYPKGILPIRADIPERIAVSRGGGLGESSASLVRIKINVTTGGKCPQPVGLFHNKLTGKTVIIPCNSWSCPHCGKIKKNRVADRVKKGFDADLIIPGHRIRSITLTQKLGSVRDIMKDWAVMRDRKSVV